MTRFIQQQIPPKTTRQVPEAWCPSCGSSVLVGSADKRHVPSPAISSKPKGKVTASKKSRSSSNSRNKK